MNKELKEKLKEIEGIGQKIIYLESVGEKYQAKLEALKNVTADLSEMPNVKKVIEEAEASIKKELQENEAEIAKLKEQLPH